MSAKEFTDLLVEYILERKIQGDLKDGEDFSDKIWTDIKSMFSELGEYLNERGYHITIQTICRNNEFRSEHLKDSLSKFLCREIGKIFFYMEGLSSGNKKQVGRNDRQRELWNHLKCMVGTVALIKLYGKHCKIKEITEHVSSIMNMMEDSFGLGHNREKCKWANFDALRIGTRFMGEAMDEWVTEWRKRQHRINAGNQAQVCTRNRGTQGTDDAGQQAKEGNSIEILESTNLGTATEWMDKKEYMKKSDVKELIKKVGESKNSQEGKNILNTEISKWEQARPNGPDKETARAAMPAEAGGRTNGVHATLRPTTSTSPGMSEADKAGNAGGTAKITPENPADNEPATQKEPTADKTKKTDGDPDKKKAESKEEKTPEHTDKAGTPRAPAPAPEGSAGGAGTNVARKEPEEEPPPPAPSPAAPPGPPPASVSPQAEPTVVVPGKEATPAPGKDGQPSTGGQGPNKDTAGKIPLETASAGSVHVKSPRSEEDCGKLGPDPDRISECLETVLEPKVHNVSVPTDEPASGQWGIPGSSGSTTISIGTSTTTQNVPTGKDVTSSVDVSGSAATEPSAATTPTNQTQPEPASTTTSTSSGPDPAAPGPKADGAADNADTGGPGLTGSSVTNPDGENAGLPPLNPPKPKPNPDQTDSSSGSGPISTGGEPGAGGGGVGGGSGGGGGGSGSAEKDACLSSNSGSSSGASVLLIDIPRYADGTGGHFGTGPTPGPRGQAPQNGQDNGPFLPDLTGTVLTATTPILFFLTAVTVALLGYSLWKYFAHLAKRRRTFRTVRDVPSPQLDEEILQHLQRGAPPPDYAYTMVMDRRAASAADRRRRHPRVHKRTIIELHLEVLHECEAAAWENVKDGYLQIIVEEFAQDLMRDDHRNNNILDVSTSDHGLPGNHVPSTLAPPTDSDGTNPCPDDDPAPWSCMETIPLETGPCAPNDCASWSCMETTPLATDASPRNEDDPDPWSCMETMQLATAPCAPNDCDPWSYMETIQFATDPCPPNEDNHDPWSCMETTQLDAQPDPHSSPRHECPIPDDINWINWIDRNKRILRECTTQPWVVQLKSNWKQYLRAHMVAKEDNGVSGQRELTEQRSIGCVEMKKDAWKKWVAQQHHDMAKYIESDCFRHLLENIDQETVPEKGALSVVDADFAVENVMAAEDVLRVRALPRSQPMHPQPYMKKPLTATIWILILALIIEECEVERSLQARELYVDELLQKL
ncbi:hypothetical protein AK88_01253 [Plasmodium fragile]|uniref:Schizont-infected cell agglutination C-terminal domain-containing protein n=1 Tax=Plasmodium fragile TaxID=5857 RepID=A0A0D9QQX0_PLAFR|nr:uncharacterized protein AK88_01253 [Plasmodium fragile]KJP89167.1 hypothetical protein AK88_01253 [Plasmodium fragile]